MPLAANSSLGNMPGAAASLSLSAVKFVADAMFLKGTPIVAEAHSAIGAKLKYYTRASDVVALAKRNAKYRNGAVHLAVLFPDTRGRFKAQRISIAGTSAGNPKYRCSSKGWGLIFVYLAVGRPVGIKSFVSANSEKRARGWSATYPELGLPDAWDWSAVKAHLVRLRGALRKVA
jgi:hypothetical protein